MDPYYPWATGPGQTTNQWVKILLPGSATYSIDRIRVMPRIDFPDQRVRDIQISVSTTTADDSAFTTVLTATAAYNATLQEFVFPGGPVAATYVRYSPLNNRGSTCCISTQRLMVMTGPVNERNVSLLNAGAAVHSWSSYTYHPNGMLDYVTDDLYGWLTGWLQITNQWVKFSFPGGATYTVDRVRLTPGYYPSERVKDFRIDVSTTTADDASFTTVLTATADNNNGMQEFVFPGGPVLAKFVRYAALNNRGSPYYIATRQLRVMSPQEGELRTVAFRNLSTDPDGDIASYLWDFGDGATSTDAEPTHTFPAGPSASPVSLTVTDATGLSSSFTLTQKVLAAPVPNFSFSPLTPNEGQYVTFTDGSTDPDGGTIISRRWTWHEGYSTPGSPVSRAFCDNATYLVTLDVVDAQEQTARIQKSVTPVNVPPNVNAGADRNWVSGERLFFPPSVYDPGWCDYQTYRWNYGDGSPLGTTSYFDKTYSVPIGSPPVTYAANLTVTDDDGGVGSDGLNVQVFPQMFRALPNSALPSPYGLGWSTLAGKLVATRDSCENRIMLVDLDGTARFVTPAIAKQCGETKIAVGNGLGGFGLGDVFLGNGKPGQLVRVQMTAGGTLTRLDNPWVTMTTVASWGRLHGLAFDESGAFGGDLLAVWTDGKAFRVKADGTFSLVANLGIDLTGAAVAPAAGFGPASGCLLTTDRWSKNIRAVCPSGSTFVVRNISGASYALEDVNLVRGAGDFFLLDFDQSGKAYTGDSRSFGSSLTGHVLVTTLYNGEVWDLSYDAATNSYQTRLFSLAMRPGQATTIHMEQTAFVPALRSSKAGLEPRSALKKVGESHTIRLTVKDSSGYPVSGLALTFRVAGANPATFAATTDAQGLAGFTYTGTNAGLDTIVADSNGVTTLPATVLWALRASTLEANPAFVSVEGTNAAAYFPELSARLTETANGQALDGRTVGFYTTDSNGASVFVCSAVTDAGGWARCGDAVQGVSVAAGLGYRAEFAGDATYLPSSDTAPLARVRANVL